jgi:hypothetical protein
MTPFSDIRLPAFRQKPERLFGFIIAAPRPQADRLPARRSLPGRPLPPPRKRRGPAALARRRDFAKSIPAVPTHRTASKRPSRYLPLESNAAHLFFQLISRRYERGAILLTSNPRLVSANGAPCSVSRSSQDASFFERLVCLTRARSRLICFSDRLVRTPARFPLSAAIVVSRSRRGRPSTVRMAAAAFRAALVGLFCATSSRRPGIGSPIRTAVRNIAGTLSRSRQGTNSGFLASPRRGGVRSRSGVPASPWMPPSGYAPKVAPTSRILG